MSKTKDKKRKSKNKAELRKQCQGKTTQGLRTKADKVVNGKKSKRAKTTVVVVNPPQLSLVEQHQAVRDADVLTAHPNGDTYSASAMVTFARDRRLGAGIYQVEVPTQTNAGVDSVRSKVTRVLRQEGFTYSTLKNTIDGSIVLTVQVKDVPAVA